MKTVLITSRMSFLIQIFSMIYRFILNEKRYFHFATITLPSFHIHHKDRFVEYQIHIQHRHSYLKSMVSLL